MAAMRANPRLQVGAPSWIAEERASALQIAEMETEEFTFSARNEVDWLNEHMAEIFSENQVNVADIFKTPGKLRGKTPRTARKNNPLETRAPLSDVFAATPRGGPSPFKQLHFEKPVPTFQVAEDEPEQPEVPAVSSIPGVEDPFQTKPATNAPNFFDSGYHGSQPTQDATQATQSNDPMVYQPTPEASPPKVDLVEADPADNSMEEEQEGERRSTEGSFQSAREEQTRHMTEDVAPHAEVTGPSKGLEQSTQPVLESPLQNRKEQTVSPQKRSPERPAAVSESPVKLEEQVIEPEPTIEDEHMDDVQSPSDGSSPLRPIVRKSSLNFASLPAREPLTTKKSIGNRVSRTSHLEQSRTSYYGRQTGGKSLGNVRQEDQEQVNDDDMDADELDAPEPVRDAAARLHNKTSTQRLQDQISRLGQSQSNVRPPSKSIAGSATVPVQPTQAPVPAPVTQEPRQPNSPQRKERPPPGAFPEDEEDSWIGPSTAAAVERSIFSPRPHMTKSHSTDVMEEIRGKDSIGGAQFNIPKRGEEPRQKSPLREQPTIPERTTSTLGHIKSFSTSVLRSPKKAGESPENKTISVSNPNPSTGSEESTTPPKSPSRSYRGSPLKAAKDKFSSILKTSRGLFASSAAVSADAKSSALSPVSSRIGFHHAPSTTSLLHSQPSYSDLDAHPKIPQSPQRPDSPTKASARKTRASTEREERKKQEEAREAKAAKEAQKMNDQLEKARQKVKNEARVAMEKEVAARKEQERLAKASQADVPRATRSSPRKTKAQLQAEGIAAAAPTAEELSSRDVDMSDASQAMPPPPGPRPKSQIGRPAAKRPLKPAKEPASKAKPPTVIRVDTGSQRGHQYHPSNSTLAATLQESLSSSQPAASSQGTLRHKASTSSIQSKTSSTTSFKSAATKALEAAARKKEQDELAAQRKREAKQDIERQRAAIKEEERRKEEQQRRQEAERQRELQRERERAVAAADAKKAASRQAIEKRRLEMEKAKETRAPPPAVRPQPSGDHTNAMSRDKALPPVPQSKAPQMNSAAPRSQEDPSRLVNSMMHNSTKAPPKRPLQQDDGDEHHSRPTIQRNGPSYQHNEARTKRRKTSDAFDDDDLTENQPKMTAPPIRQSSSRPKEMPTKSLFPSGYANAPPPASNLQRSTLISQHNMNQSKPAHPMDMAQVSKAPIAFASSSVQGNAQPYKTPARPRAPNGIAKSTAKSAKSSPRYQNGENIVLPEIHTDSEDEDSDDAGSGFPAPPWVDSPEIRKALVEQEGMDPTRIFGPPAPLNMEEVFSKSKDRFHKFRQRTSSANWSGQDRLTEDEIRKDLEGRDKLRRLGTWTYDSMV